jgi:hypothetical protein
MVRSADARSNSATGTRPRPRLDTKSGKRAAHGRDDLLAEPSKPARALPNPAKGRCPPEFPTGMEARRRRPKPARRPGNLRAIINPARRGRGKHARGGEATAAERRSGNRRALNQNAASHHLAGVLRRDQLVGGQDVAHGRDPLTPVDGTAALAATGSAGSAGNAITGSGRSWRATKTAPHAARPRPQARKSAAKVPVIPSRLCKDSLNRPTTRDRQRRNREHG